MTKESRRREGKGRLHINASSCAGCSYCKLNCPAGAMAVERAIARPTDACTLCGACVWVCPVGAISMGTSRRARGGRPGPGEADPPANNQQAGEIP